MKRALGILALLLMTATHAASAAPAVHRLTLKDTITMALEKNNGIKAAGYHVE